MKRIVVDIDNTITITESNDYFHAKPIPENIEKINKYYDSGWEVIYYTARGGTSGQNCFEFTLAALKLWGCKFHELRMGKMSYDIIVDDRAKRIEEL